MKPTFFRSADAFRQWLERHGGAKQELLVGFYKTDSSKTSITWPESVDEAPSYQRAAIWWVISAKKEETRLKRAQTLIELSGQGELIPQFTKWSASRARPVEE
jgi:uncharacterized protein YdeI (YjbR/CyaY-like superfamily)